MTRFMILAILALAACTPANEPQDTPPAWQGYVEGRLLYLAPRTSGPIATLSVQEGDQVMAGAPLFSLDDGSATARLDQAQAALAATRARLADLRAGGRTEDIIAARETVSQARAALKLAQENQARSAALVEKGRAPQARLDQDNAVLTQARANVRGQEARLALIRAPARKDTIAAAADDVRMQEALVAQSRKALDDLRVIAPVDGSIQSVLRRTGEIAGPAQPVLALLPPSELRIRFFIPEPRLGAIHIGDTVQLSCDGCTADRTGKIVFIAKSAEFTPPVIFTEKERAKLVYMTEARPDNPEVFHPGQPVSVTMP